MARKFTRHNLAALKDKMEGTKHGPGIKDKYYFFDPYELPDQVKKDLKKVQFDFENYEFKNGEGYQGSTPIVGWQVSTSGLPFLGVAAGGDWEFPLFFIIYWDGKKLRGYIPTDGNTWNTDTKMAYGNDYDGMGEPSHADGKNIKKRWPDNYDIGTEFETPDHEVSSDNCPDMDPVLILADIAGHILPR